MNRRFAFAMTLFSATLLLFFLFRITPVEFTPTIAAGVAMMSLLSGVASGAAFGGPARGVEEGPRLAQSRTFLLLGSPPDVFDRVRISLCDAGMLRIEEHNDQMGVLIGTTGVTTTSAGERLTALVMPWGAGVCEVRLTSFPLRTDQRNEDDTSSLLDGVEQDLLRRMPVDVMFLGEELEQPAAQPPQAMR